MNKAIKDTLVIGSTIIVGAVVGTTIGVLGAKLCTRFEDMLKAKKLEEAIEPGFYAIVKNDDLSDMQKELRIAGEILRLKVRAAGIGDDDLRERIQAKIDECGAAAKDMLKAA